MPSDKPYLEVGDEVTFTPQGCSAMTAILSDYTLPVFTRDHMHLGVATLVGPKIVGSIDIPLFQIEEQNKLVKEHFESQILPPFYLSDFPNLKFNESEMSTKIWYDRTQSTE
jgi:hypothetical protein